MLKTYYELTKPGIIYGNALTTLAAFLYASRWHIAPAVFLATLFGIMLVIASACVFNNYFDRDIDARMERTRHRALAAGTISPRAALLYGAVLGVLGFFLLLFLTNSLAALLALAGWVLYVFAYTFSKRITHWSTVIGSVPGAIPIVVGYTAVAGRLDISALILFLTLVVWQMPHFYAIALYRAPDYASAGITVLPAVRGARTAKWHIFFYVLAFLIIVPHLSRFGAAGISYAVGTSVLGLIWLFMSMRGFWVKEDVHWARTFFLSSLIVLLLYSTILSLAAILP